jgi:hypothetical protein
VDAAKSGSQEVGAGEVFVEFNEKKQLPGFGFFRRGEIGVCPSQKTGARRKSPEKLQLGDQKLAACDNLTEDREPKWKSWLSSVLHRISAAAELSLIPGIADRGRDASDGPPDVVAKGHGDNGAHASLARIRARRLSRRCKICGLRSTFGHAIRTGTA